MQPLLPGMHEGRDEASFEDKLSQRHRLNVGVSVKSPDSLICALAGAKLPR